MKQTEVIEKRIGENTFYLRPFGAFIAANLSGELMAILTPIIGAIAPIISGAMGENPQSAEDFDIMKLDTDSALPALSKALSSLSGDDFEALMKKLLITYRNVSVEGPVTDGMTKQLDYDLANEVFCGELQDMLVLCFEVLKLNFGGFFAKLFARFGVQAAMPQVVETATKNMANLI